MCLNETYSRVCTGKNLYDNFTIENGLKKEMLYHHCFSTLLWNMPSGGLRVFENRVLKRIFGPKRDEVTEDWEKLHSEELHNFYSSPDIIRQVKSRRMRWAGHAARMGEERKVNKV
jgi:hypothetical protein